MSEDVTGTPAGSPSRTATRAGPWDSPAVSQRNTRAILPRPPGPPGPHQDQPGPAGMTPAHRSVRGLPGGVCVMNHTNDVVDIVRDVQQTEVGLGDVARLAHRGPD